MHLEHLISNYGYIAILVGSFLEGETILILGGLAAHQGFLQLPYVMLCAFAGSLCGDQLFFFLGRWNSDSLTRRRPQWIPRIERMKSLIARYQTLVILGFRFMYGLRSVTPFVLGMSRVSPARFAPLNVVGAAVWAVAVGLGGYAFGLALENILGSVKHYEKYILLTVAAAGLAFYRLRHYRRKKKNASRRVEAEKAAGD